MWYFHIWPTLMCVTVAFALENVSLKSSHLGYDGRHALRQASLSTIATTATVGYSSAATPTPASVPSVAPGPAIVISFLSPSTTTTPTSTFLSILSLQNTSTTPTYSLSLTTSPTPSTQTTAARSPFNIIYLIPAFALVGILLGALIGWVLYGCMTRKPRVHNDDAALVIGPRYIGINEPERRHIRDHNIERRGQPMPMRNVPGATRASPHFRWPSFNDKPAFDPVQGFHVPDEYHFSDLPLAVRNTNVNSRTQSTRTTRTSKSVRTTRSTTAGPSRNDFPSSPTSLALLELYESDEEEETRRKAHEVPWESLRHKSIKRGIIEEVKKEGKWMDSLRGLAGSTLLGSHSKVTMEEGNVLLSDLDADDSMEVDSYVGRRRRYSIPDSDPFADSPTRTRSISPRKRPIAKPKRTESTNMIFPASTEPRGAGFQIIPESAATTPNQSPRRSFTWLKKGDRTKAPEKLTRLPTPVNKLSQTQSQSKSSRSSSPVKRTSNNDLHISQLPRRDILPRSPAQIMSPPLHNQMCFTPALASPARSVHLQSTRDDYHPKSRVSVSLSPTKPLMVSSVSKSKRRVQSPRNLYRLPKPPSSVIAAVPQHEVSRGRMLHDTSTTNKMDQLASRSKALGNVETPEPDMLEDPMKKVEQIMASSWSARDLGQGGIRSLSPTGFGRRI